MNIKNRKYKVIDYVRIPFKIDPFMVIAIVILRLLVALVPSLMVLATSSFIDTSMDIFQNGEVYRIYISLFSIIALVGFAWTSSMLLSFVNLRLHIKVNEGFYPAVVKKRNRLSYVYVENNDTWELITRVGEDTSERILKGLDNLLDIIEYVVKITSLIMLIAAHVWWVAIAIVMIAIPLLSLSFKSGVVNYEAFTEAEKYRRRADYLKEVLSSRENVEERVLFGYAKAIDEMWFERYETARKIEFNVEKKIFIKTKTASIITVFLSMAIALVLLTPVASGAITVGMYMSLITASFNLVQHMSWELAMVMQEYTKNKLYLKELTTFSALEEIEEADELPEVWDRHKPFENIELKDIHFTYPGTNEKILNGLSMKLEKDKQYAFVGRNGAGKTTITKLLTGLYDNYEGDILINGKNLRTLTQKQLKGCFSVVYQDFAKYHVSLKDNVMLGSSGVTYSEEEEKILVEAALTTIEMNEEVEKLPKGMDTDLGKLTENSMDLSGGQWQRIAIARTLVSNAPVCILDEPTAAIDPISESKVYKMFGKASKEKLTILITHRLGAARIADEILVIDHGIVAEKGSHEELVNKKGIYAEMFESQRRWYNE